MKRVSLNILGLILTWIVWLWLIGQELGLACAFGIAVGGILVIIPVVFVGRRLFDRQPTIEQADLLTTILHYLVAIFFGSVAIAATKFGLRSPSWSISIPPWMGQVLMMIGGISVLIAGLYLAIKGLGAPFAMAHTRIVATEWRYAWTRNPMILGALATLVGLGLWFRSTLFLVWVIIVVCPVIFLFLKVYEERELEIRFGEAYFEYKARTHIFIPRKPGDKPNGGAV